MLEFHTANRALLLGNDVARVINVDEAFQYSFWELWELAFVHWVLDFSSLFILIDYALPVIDDK